MKRRQFLPSLIGVATVPLSFNAQSKPATSSVSSSFLVEAVQMPAWVDRSGWRRPVSPGERVWSTETIETGPNASVVMQLPEGSLIRLGENTKLGIQQLEVDASTGQPLVRSKLKLLEGVFRFATSSVSKVFGVRQIELSMRTATAGIRGTDFWSMSDAEHDATCLFEGQLDMQTNDQGNFALAQPTAFWARYFDKPIQPVGLATPAQLQKFLGSTELSPGSGVAVLGGKWRITVPSINTATRAGELSKALNQMGFTSSVHEQAANPNRSYQVRISQIASEADARSIESKLASVLGANRKIERYE